MVVLGGGAVSYEQGSPVRAMDRTLSMALRGRPLFSLPDIADRIPWRQVDFATFENRLVCGQHAGHAP